MFWAGLGTLRATSFNDGDASCIILSAMKVQTCLHEAQCPMAFKVVLRIEFIIDGQIKDSFLHSWSVWIHEDDDHCSSISPCVILVCNPQVPFGVANIAPDDEMYGLEWTPYSRGDNAHQLQRFTLRPANTQGCLWYKVGIELQLAGPAFVTSVDKHYVAACLMKVDKIRQTVFTCCHRCHSDVSRQTSYIQ